MKLSSFVIATCITLFNAPITRVTAFSQINSPLRANQPATKQARATTRFASVAEESSTETTLDYAGVKKLTFRELQKQCKERGLPAVGNTATLRTRLYEALGIMECETENEENVSVKFLSVDYCHHCFFNIFRSDQTLCSQNHNFCGFP